MLRMPGIVAESLAAVGESIEDRLALTPLSPLLSPQLARVVAVYGVIAYMDRVAGVYSDSGSPCRVSST